MDVRRSSGAVLEVASRIGLAALFACAFGAGALAQPSEPPASEPPAAPESDAEPDVNETEPTETEPAEVEPVDDESTPDEDIAALSLEDLLHVTIVSANRREERLIDAPAPMVVISAADIRDRGYTDIADIIADLPGFDISLSNGADYMNAYQRGYRTPYTQRTLFLINGQVDNHLYWQTAQLSRQLPISNIERVEVLYGPASVVYGPNAFLGVINVITHDGRDLDDGDVDARVQLGAGSFATRSIDASVNARVRDFTAALSFRLFRSDEPDLSGRGPWLSNSIYRDANIWGPLVDRTQLMDGTIASGIVAGMGNTPLPGLQNEGRRLGSYADPTDDYGLIGTFGYRGLTLGLLQYRMREGYGAQYTADHGQNNSFWNKRSFHIYGQYRFEPVAGLRSTTLLMFRRSDLGGDWAEAEPDWNPGMDAYSYVSFSQWNSDNDSIVARQNFEYELLGGDLVLSAGLTYERKDLTRNYDISGYWNDAFSSVSHGDTGPEGLGPGVVHSSSLLPYDVLGAPPRRNPNVNRILTTDYGGFVAANASLGAVRLVGGIRVDHNSIYGTSVNPRAAFIYRFLHDRAAFKLIAGTAFQEPAYGMLFGGWNGRAANPDLRPERAYDGDAVLMLQSGRFLGDLSVFYAHYTHVILEQSKNQGSRDIVGGELKLRLTLPNPVPNTRDLSLFVHLSTALSYSSVHFDFATGDYVPGRTSVGDIAPVTLHAGATWPILDWLTLTVRSTYVSDRTLYMRNALRDPSRPDGGRRLDGYVTFDAFLRAEWRFLHVGFRVRNLFNALYDHPGLEQADGGDDTSATRSGGYRNSVIPQPGRSFYLTLGLDL